MSASVQGALAFQKGLGCVHSLSHSLTGLQREQPPLGQLTVGIVGECRQGGVRDIRAHQAVALRHRVLALAVAGPLGDTRA
jgi:hypothetical protein